MPRFTRVVLWVYIVFNVAIALTLIFQPGPLDATYQGGAMTATRRFQWFSIATFHLFVIGATLISLRMRHAAERRWIHLLNAGFYLWDAATQWLYWGKEVGLRPVDLHTNAGVSAAVGVVMLAAWWVDKDQRESRAQRIPTK
ncbi:MAG: hypothetical protein R3B70_42455 [Polyangiaceae bacterium]